MSAMLAAVLVVSWLNGFIGYFLGRSVEKRRISTTKPECRALSAWQSIETAPKDGTDILLWDKDGGRYIGSWFQGYPERGWWVSHALHVSPTRWISLPSLPTGSDA